MTSKWNYCPLTSTQQEAARRLAERFAGVPPVSELLAQRGVNDLSEADRFLYPSLRDLHDPFLMPGMDKAVARLNAAMGAKEKIMVYGDYDVDGTTAVALVYKYLRAFYSSIEYYIPTRSEDGYGISEATIDMAAERGVSLFIILDCGIKATEEVRYALEKGIDFIICDHHMADDELPPAAAILNPKLKGSTYPCPHLSGCGVGFKLMQAFAISNGLGMSELEGMLDLVAVSIAADIVPMVGENRILTYWGMRRLNTNPNIGLRAIIRTCGLSGKECTVSDVIFKIGPRINASGRMQSGKEAVDLLVSRDMGEAMTRAREIDRYNRERKELDKQITDEALSLISESTINPAERSSVVVYHKDWHTGIIGIVASRLTEQYYKPSVVLTNAGGLATGSSRSVQGFDVYSAVASARHLLENFGGHTYAVGLSLKEENVPEFTRLFEEYVSTHIAPEQREPMLDIDAYITFAEITPDFLAILRRFNPFGPGNQKPVFCTRGVTDFGSSKAVGRNLEHIKLDIVDDTSGKVFSAIAFNVADKFDYIHSGGRFSICYTIEETHRKGQTSFQLLVKSIRPTPDE
ncbi:MAG: single-stranded-DNA-specific exonuclease RecJ [Duncaniella sp.]|nr:single-stranded-DNA-specific exonuclease RecJ [Duncaniella sp.]